MKPLIFFKSQFQKKAVFLLLLFLMISTFVQAQYFGRNKPRYRSFDFQVTESPNFRVYQYLNNQALLDTLVRDSERWYMLHQSVLRDTIKFKNPIIFYNNHADFQQTTAISGPIGPSTGGVTEGLKNRVVMPVTSSIQETNHVLGHELVHAFQYNMMRAGDSTSLGNIRNLPLWMVEGLAEYMSIGSLDPNTSIWMRDAVLNEDVPTLEDLSRQPNRYFPYRYGEAFWAFVTGVWGDKAIAPLFKATAIFGYNAALDTLFGINEETLSNMWATALEKHYRPYLETTDTIAVGTNIAGEETQGTRMNMVPTLSPDGKYVAYYSERNIFTIDLFLADAQTGNIIKKLSSEAQNNHVDNFSIMESAGTFSPRGNQFAFVVFSEGKNKLAVVDVANPGRQKLYEIKGVPSFNNPAWSPDGNSIVVTGTVNGQPDLYAFNIKTKEVEQLTDDYYAELQPKWSPDGQFLVFSTDRIKEGALEPKKRSYQIALMNAKSGEIDMLDIFPGASNLNPSFDETGKTLYFLSDRDGFRNLYSYNFENDQVYQYTQFFTGISGVTHLSPALTVASETGRIIYSYYRANAYELFSASPEEFEAREADPAEVNFDAATLPPTRDTKPRIVNNLLSNFNNVPTVPLDSIEKVPYKPQFQLDYISNTGVGVATSRFGTGLAGGVNMLFSDILGNQQLFGGVALNGEIYDFGGQVAYVNQKYRFGWGASISHIPYRSAGLAYKRDSIAYGDDQIPVMNVQMDMLRIFEDQLSVFGFYPFSTIKRLEFGASAGHYGFRRDQYNNYYYFNSRIAMDREQVDAPEGYYLHNANAAFVSDNSHFGITSPMMGNRYRVEAQKYLGALDFYTLLADFRRYIFIKPISLAFRFIHYGRYGGEAADIPLYPLYVGNPVYVRGYDSRSVRSNITRRDNYIDQLTGNKLLVGNFEVRIPFSGPKILALIESSLLFTDLNFFIDGGMAYNSTLPFNTNEAGELMAQSTPVYSTGVSVRINLFGQLILEPYYAFPIQENGLSRGNFGLNFLPGW